MLKSFRHRFLIEFGGPWNLKNLQKPFVFQCFLRFRQVALDSHLGLDFEVQEASKMEPKRLRNRNINEVKNQSDLEHDFEANLSQLGPPRGASWGGISVIYLMFFACYVGKGF